MPRRKIDLLDAAEAQVTRVFHPYIAGNVSDFPVTSSTGIPIEPLI